MIVIFVMLSLLLAHARPRRFLSRRLAVGRTLELNVLNANAYKLYKDLASSRSLATILAAAVELDRVRRQGEEVVQVLTVLSFSTKKIHYMVYNGVLQAYVGPVSTPGLAACV